jgi:ketosteroid isomerase-like protein
MKRNQCVLMSAAIVVVLGLAGLTRGGTAEDKIHDELRGLLKEVLTDYNAGDMDKLMTYLDDNVIITWQNGKVTRGHKEFKDFYEQMTKGPNKVVQSSTINPVPDDLSLLYNDGKTAVAWGNSKDHYKLTNGLEFDQDTRWSATVINENGKWKLANAHISTNMFDNPVLHIAIRKTAQWVGGIAGAGGLILGIIGTILVARYLSRKRRQAA